MYRMLNDKFEGVELDYITWKINSLPSINRINDRGDDRERKF